MDTPRDDLFRAQMVMRPTIREAEDGSGLGVLYGYAAITNQWTEIESWEGNFMERLAKGAFRKTLRERGSRVKVLLNHGYDPMIGDKPLGVPTVLREDDNGLYHETPLIDTTYNRDVAEMIRSGAIDGQSFRFSIVEDSWNDEPEPSPDNPKALPERTIRSVKLYEIGPVTFPAYEATTLGIRSAAAYAHWLRTWQMDDNGMTVPSTSTSPAPMMMMLTTTTTAASTTGVESIVRAGATGHDAIARITMSERRKRVAHIKGVTDVP